MKLGRIAQSVKGKLFGKADFEIKNILPPEEAKEHDLTFLFDEKTRTKARAVISHRSIKNKFCIIVNDPKLAMYDLLRVLSKRIRRPKISSDAMIDTNADVAKGCVIEPFAVIEKNVSIGKNAYIGAGAYIGNNVRIGDFCEVYPQTVIYGKTEIGNHVVIDSNTVIGKQGFGYVKQRQNRYHRIEHVGMVVIGDYVEIGSNVTIDRATIGTTLINKGTKIDNLVHIGHNVKIGKNCLIMGQCGIAGSSTIGNNVILCGQVGISDHVNIGDNAVVYAKSAVFKSLRGDKHYSGIPAREHRLVLRALARLYKTETEE